MRLSRKVALLAVTNLLLLAGVLAVFFQWQFRSGTQSLLLGPVQDRIMAIANRFSVELSGMPQPQVDSLFASYKQRYRADFFLTTPSGEVLAGPEIVPPPEVQERMRPRRPPRDGAPPPPPRDPDRRKEARKGPPPPRRDGPRGPAEPSFFVISHQPTYYWAGARIPITVPDVERAHRRSCSFAPTRSSTMSSSSTFACGPA
jgi:hypothetical protein